jgi:hypothetical protein
VKQVKAAKARGGDALALEDAAADRVAQFRSYPTRPLGRFQFISVVAFQILPIVIVVAEAIALARVT